MTDQQKTLLAAYHEDIEKLNRQRHVWMVASSLVFIGVIFIVVAWSPVVNFHSPVLLWALGSTGLLITVNWWYWTMMFVRRILMHQRNIAYILGEITVEVQDVKHQAVNLMVS